MQSLRIVIQFNIIYDYTACFLEVEMPDIRHLNFERVPKAFNRLVVTRSSGAGHTFAKSEAFYKLFCFLRDILATSVATKYRISRTVGISPCRHFYTILHKLLPLMLGNRLSSACRGLKKCSFAFSVMPFR